MWFEEVPGVALLWKRGGGIVEKNSLLLKTKDMAFMGALHPFIRSFLGKNKIKTEKVTEVAIRNNIPQNIVQNLF